MEKEKNYMWLNWLARVCWAGFFILFFLGMAMGNLMVPLMHSELVLALTAIYVNAVHYAHTSDNMDAGGWALITIKLICSSLFFFFGIFTGWGMVGLTLFVIVPFIALIVGVQGAFRLINEGSKAWGLITFLTAIAPFVLAGILIFLTQSGLLVIRFM